MRRLKTRLRDQRRDQEKPVPTYITYDSMIMTADQAIEAAERAGKIPPNAVLVLLPERAKDHATWERLVQSEAAEREHRHAEVRRQSAARAGTDPAGPSGSTSL